MKEEKVIDFREEYDKYIDEWDIIGVKDKYRCPECEYLGEKCDIHKNEEEY